MRVHIRITMTWKMLAHRKYATFFQSTGIGYYFIGHISRTFSKRTGIDNRVLRVDIHIRHRSKVNLHTEFPTLPGHLTTIFIKQTVILYTAQNHISGKYWCTSQAHGKSPFAVKGYHQRNICHLLCFIGQYRLVFHQSTGKEQAAHFVAIHNFT